MTSHKKHPDGEVTTVQAEIMENHLSFWKAIYNPDSTGIDMRLQDKLINEIQQKISVDHRKYMEQLISAEEIERTIRKLNGDCAPGSDGFTNSIFKANPTLWSITLERVFSANDSIGEMAPSQRKSVISLLYKKNDPMDPANYRPISLLNTDAKIFTKILTRRLKPIITSIVDDRQTGFMPGRSIQQNIRRIMDLMHWCLQTNTEATLVLLDFQKAYDKVNWAYLNRVIDKLGFGPGFQRQIKTIYNNRRFSIMINNCISGEEISNSGVIQGDPLSCFLFAINLFPLMNLMNAHKDKGIQIQLARS